MYIGVLHAHSGLRWLFLALAILVIVVSIIGLIQKKESISKTYGLLWRVFLGIAHFQLVLGFVLLFVSPVVQNNLSNIGEVMKDSGLRKIIVEHPIMMLLAVVLLTIGKVKAFKSEGQGVFKKSLLFVGISLVVVLAAIPW